MSIDTAITPDQDTPDQDTPDQDTPDQDTDVLDPEVKDTGEAPERSRTRLSAGRLSRAAGDVADRRISLRALAVGVVIIGLIAAVATFGWLWADRGSEIAGFQRAQDGRARAEKVALDYATGAADMNFGDPEGWRTRLTKGTTPELATRLQKASSSMEQLIKPLQWSSTADPIAAKTASEADGVYQVEAFVNVFTKNAQAPDGIESTATYKLTIDSNNGWVITDISGIGSELNGGQPVAPK